MNTKNPSQNRRNSHRSLTDTGFGVGSKSSRNRNAWSVLIMAMSGTILVSLFYLYWGRPPAVAFDNLRYIQLLRTACSSQRSDHVEKVESALQSRRAEGKVSSKEWEHFQSIIERARRKEWEAADRACWKFEEAQLNRKR